MSIAVLIELRAKPGMRGALLHAIDELAETMTHIPGFLGAARYQPIDDPDTIIEIADWESAEARETWLAQSADSIARVQVRSLLGAPFKATVLKPLD